MIPKLEPNHVGIARTGLESTTAINGRRHVNEGVDGDRHTVLPTDQRIDVAYHVTALTLEAPETDQQLDQMRP